MSSALTLSSPACPFDVVTRRVQAQAESPGSVAAAAARTETVGTRGVQQQSVLFRNSRDAARQIVKHEGVLTLWRGLGPTLWLTVPATAFYFTFYQTLKETMEQSSWVGTSVAQFVPLIAGPISRTGTVLLTAPLELARTNVQSRAKSAVVNDGTFALLRHVVRTEGWRGLHRGVLPTLWRDVPFSAIYWFLYEQSVQSLAKRANAHGLTSGTADREHFAVYLAAGALSGGSAATITHPFDVLKTRRQMYLARLHDAAALDAKSKPETTVRGISSAILRDEGVVGFYRGLAPRLSKVAPACAIMISSYNFCLSKIRHVMENN